jgi:hypothetical protein
MTVLFARQGPLRSAIEQELSRGGHEVVLWDDEDDLFDVALGSGAIVYVPFARTLDARTAPRPDAERARKVVRAANAPAVEVVIFVLPARGFEVEEEVLRREGKLYVVVRAPLLIEEVAEVVAQDRFRSLWLPREGEVEVASAEAVGQAALEATVTEEQGGDLPVASSCLTAPELFERASELAGEVKVHAVRPRIYRMVRPIARWLKGGEAAALGLWDGLAEAS